MKYALVWNKLQSELQFIWNMAQPELMVIKDKTITISTDISMWQKCIHVVDDFLKTDLYRQWILLSVRLSAFRFDSSIVYQLAWRPSKTDQIHIFIEVVIASGTSVGHQRFYEEWPWWSIPASILEMQHPPAETDFN